MKLTIEKIIYGGQGLARIPETEGAQAGKRIFIPFTLPGEQVAVDLLPSAHGQSHRGYASGHLLQVEKASPLRAHPACPYFTRCGGCHLQHATYAGQVEIKRGVLRETLERAGLQHLPEISARYGDPLAYRNRMRLHLQTQPNFAIGYREQHAHTLVPIAQCPIVTPLLERCLDALRALGEAKAIPEGIHEMELLANPDTPTILLSAFTSQNDPQLRAHSETFFAALSAQVPELAGAALLQRGTGRNASPETQTLLRWKAQSLHYRVGAYSYRISLGAFFQVNSSLLASFVALVTEDARGQKAWDLYAGVGLFARVLTESFSHVTAVEVAVAAVEDLRHNLAGLPATVVATTTESFLQHALEERRVSPDLTILDPPRAGLGIDGVNLLARCRPRRIVYVSCDPATLSRDLKALIESGYRLDRLHMVDMFPQTYHQETVAVLVR